MWAVLLQQTGTVARKTKKLIWKSYCSWWTSYHVTKNMYTVKTECWAYNHEFANMLQKWASK